MTQQKRSTLPGEVYDLPWIGIRHPRKDYPKHSERGGKWLFYIPIERVDKLWEQVRNALLEGRLGTIAKVATMYTHPNEVRPGEKVICVYTYDSQDKTDVLRVLTTLRDIGIPEQAYYKEDEATRQNRYSNRTHRRVSKYWADYGETTLR